MDASAARFVTYGFEPAYLQPENRARLEEKVAAAREGLRCCHACPRRCGVDRLNDRTGYCRTGRYARVASAFAHHGEESCLSGWAGSGTIFFATCNLRCVFCQNWDISQRTTGRPMDGRQIAAIMMDLQEQGCHNINFVTPEHVVPQVIEAIVEAVGLGLRLPIVYNTSAYDSLDSLRLLDGLVDIYMPDFKLWNPTSTARYLNAEDYADRAREAVAEMHRQVGDLRFAPDGTARRGLLVRHLVMPGLLDETRAIFRWLAESVSKDTFVNIMGQYHPDNLVGTPAKADERGNTASFDEINRRPTPVELREAYEAAAAAGLWRFDR